MAAAVRLTGPLWRQDAILARFEMAGRRFLPTFLASFIVPRWR